MGIGVRIGGFVLVLLLLLGGGYALGQVTGAGAPAPERAGHGESGDGHRPAPGHGEHNEGGEYPGGLLVSDRGYTFQPVATEKDEFAFQITGPNGEPVTRFIEVHDKRMHLIVVRRDLTGFRHVHPEMDDDGTWRVASPLGEPGSYRAYADFTPHGGEALALGVDLAVPGEFHPKPLPSPAARATVDGYTVTLDGKLRPGRTSRLTLSVRRNGDPVTDLQPYLGAYGHLVALRAGDLAYLHVHPESGDKATRSGPAITFSAEVPSAGSYRLFLDFKHRGKVRTAEFTVTAGASPPTGAAPGDPADHGHN